MFCTGKTAKLHDWLIKCFLFFPDEVGLWIDAGSRYENEKNNGTAHFLEHMAFKVSMSIGLQIYDEFLS